VDVRRTASFLTLVAALSTGCSSKSQSSSPGAASLPKGIDTAGMDTSVAPGDDFYAYTNGGWMKSTTIPPDKPSYGAIGILIDRTRQQTIEIIQDPSNTGASASADARKIGDFYSSFIDEAPLNPRGRRR